MRALSDDAKQALLDGNAVVKGFADLYLDDELLRAVPLDASQRSEVTVDSSAANLRTATLYFAPDEADEVVPLLPLASGPLAPIGSEARVYVELTLPSGDVESLTVATLGIRRPEAATGRGVAVSVAAKDRSQRVIDARLPAPYDVAAGTNTATGLRDLVAAGVPGLTYVGFDPADTPFTTSALHFAANDDRWRRATEWADSTGRRIYFDPDGALVLAPIPDRATTPAAWDYAAGPDSLTTRIRQALNADETYSHAVVIGQPASGTTAPLRADAYDDDPGSSTYWLGPFGDRVVQMESSYISTQAQADEAVRGLLRRKSGLIEDLEVDAMSVYAHEDWDVVRVADAELGIDSHYLLSRFPVPLGPAEVTYTMRGRRVVV